MLKRILNYKEEGAWNELEKIAHDYAYHLYTKVRLADVFYIENSGISHDLYSFALKSHFDFIVCGKNQKAIFTVEFDGPSHENEKQTKLDQKKNFLCEKFELPILRINTNHLIKKYNKTSLLRWIISAWELQKAFDEAQEQGMVPQDEIFDPLSFYHAGKTIEEVHPHWISLRARLQMQKLHKQDKIIHPCTSGRVGRDKNDNYRGIEFIHINEDQVIFVESAMREQKFPLYLGDLFNELLFVLVFDKLSNFLKTGNGVDSIKLFNDRLAWHEKHYQLCFAHSCG